MADSLRKDVNSASRIRKSRSELVKEKLGSYFKQRNYVLYERYRKSDFILSQTKKQFIFNKMIENDVSKVNSFLYSNAICFTNNFSAVEAQFSKFVKFVEAQSDPAKAELKTLFGPLICHLYIELIKSREWKIAAEFLKKYASLISPVENYNAPLPNKVNGCSISGKMHEDPLLPTASSQIIFSCEYSGNPINEHFKSLLQTLSTCLRIENIEANESLVLFRSAKYELDLSDSTLNLLKQFLENQGHVIILNIFQSWINIEITELKESEKIDETDSSRISPMLSEDFGETDNDYKVAKSKKYILKDGKSDCSDDKTNKKASNSYLRRVKHAATKLQNIDQPTRNFIIADRESNLICSSLDSNQCHVAAGFENSVVKLWHVNQGMFVGKNLYSRHSSNYCSWNDDVEEEDDEEDDFSFPKEYEDDNLHKIDYLSSSGVTCLRGHTEGVTDIHFSKKYPALLTVSKDKTMRIWQSSDKGRESAKYVGHNYPIWCLSESPIDSYVATGSKDLTAKLWCLNRKSPVVTYVGHTEDVESIAFHPNGNYVATGSSDLSVRLWSVSSGRLFRVFADCKFPVTKVSFSPDGKFLAAAGEEKIVRIYDLAASSQIVELKDHSSQVSDICWNHNGKLLVSACSDGSIRLWDIVKLDTKNPRNTTNKLLWGINSGNRSIKVVFNSLDMITLIAAKVEV